VTTSGSENLDNRSLAAITGVEVFARMSGSRSSVAQVLAGIDAAERTGFQELKINTVVQRGVNDHTVMDMVQHFRGSGHI
jgi:cyclic pyranopterin phosphate synthase